MPFTIVCPERCLLAVCDYASWAWGSAHLGECPPAAAEDACAVCLWDLALPSSLLRTLVNHLIFLLVYSRESQARPISETVHEG